MRKFILFIFPLAAILLFTACTTGDITRVPKDETSTEADGEASSILEVDDEGNTKFNSGVLSGLLNETAAVELSEEEIKGIKFMLEEEKLARDVYIKLYEKWGQQTFNNISQSEETHINAVRNLAEKFGIDISFYSDNVGEFTDEALLELFNELIAQGGESLTEALKIGALIEEIDIIDLEEYSKQTQNSDIELVYENLLRGSRNHLRSFVRTMNRQGQDYEPQRLAEANYEEIVGAEIERGGYGPGSGQGPQTKGQGQRGN